MNTRLALALFLVGVGCTPGDDGGAGASSEGGGGAPTGGGGSGGAARSGGSGGGVATASGGSGGLAGSDGSGGRSAGGSAGESDGGSGGAPPVDGASSGGGTSDSLGPTADAGTGGGDRPPLGPTAPGQGPTAEGKIVYTQDFEQGMAGIERSPRGLPVDRAQIVDDPIGQRGKVMRVTWQAGDNFRTSGGTEPRSWISARPGHEFRPGTRVSHAFGFMTASTGMDFAFGQVISSNGPVWMTLGRGDGSLTVFCRPCGGNTTHMKLEAMKWYDFRIEMDYRVGGEIQFYVNGQMFTQRRIESTRGTIAHWDGGIYNRPEGTAGNRTRTVYISNLSIGEK